MVRQSRDHRWNRGGHALRGPLTCRHLGGRLWRRSLTRIHRATDGIIGNWAELGRAGPGQDLGPATDRRRPLPVERWARTRQVQVLPSLLLPGAAREEDPRTEGELECKTLFCINYTNFITERLNKRERERERVTVLKIDPTLPPAAGQVLIGYRSIVRLG
jgi:hypothetical protein